jgi:hypothetical protein
MQAVMKVRNYYIYSGDQKELQRLSEEYQMTGRDTKVDVGKLTVFALPRRKKRNK